MKDGNGTFYSSEGIIKGTWQNDTRSKKNVQIKFTPESKNLKSI